MISTRTVVIVSNISRASAVKSVRGIRIVVGSKITKHSTNSQEIMAEDTRYAFLLWVAAIPVVTPRMASTTVRERAIYSNSNFGAIYN
jgi:hypothetical protein